ncbi:hypothetical protein DSO57_1023589 [Entomophthora muscae]|uniref:Uncharacterized protein n=1 Tax=Entomophthora muscae TaxID=34485 RepID=A0ACC2U175_9FUNG|nr:hypothetical protein DSO57_1023589 [Entomophthora muscae]
MESPVDEAQLKTINYDPNTKRRRHKASQRQIDALESSFLEDAKPCREAQEQLASSLSMTLRSVQIWFQNRRAKARMAGQVLPPRPLHWKRPLVGNQDRPPSPRPTQHGSSLELQTEILAASHNESSSEVPSEPHSDTPCATPDEHSSELHKEATPAPECQVLRHAGLVTHSAAPPPSLTGSFSIQQLAASTSKKRPRYYHFVPEYEREAIALREALEKCITNDFPKEVLGVSRDGCPPPSAFPSSPVSPHTPFTKKLKVGPPTEPQPKSRKPRRKPLTRATPLTPLLPREDTA